MKKQIFLFILYFSITTCTQNFVSYIKIPTAPKIVSFEEMLVNTGLVNPTNQILLSSTNESSYTTGVLISNSPSVIQEYYTLQVNKNTNFTINIPIKNFITYVPYYSAPGFIYQEDQSIPQQGIFIFTSNEKSGQIKIRAYTPEKKLYSESTWYIEVI